MPLCSSSQLQVLVVVDSEREKGLGQAVPADIVSDSLAGRPLCLIIADLAALNRLKQVYRTSGAAIYFCEHSELDRESGCRYLGTAVSLFCAACVIFNATLA